MPCTCLTIPCDPLLDLCPWTILILPNSFFQILVLLPTIYVLTWPTDFLGVTSFISFIAVNYVDVIPVDCISKHIWYRGLYLATCIPLGLVALIWLAWSAARLVRPLTASAQFNRAVFLSLFILFSVFPSASGKILQLFNCIQLGANFYVLRYNVNTQCYTSEYYSYLGYAIASLLIFPVGIPVLFFTLLASRARKGLLLTVGNRARFGLLTNGYVLPRFWWFEEAVSCAFGLLVCGRIETARRACLPNSARSCAPRPLLPTPRSSFGSFSSRLLPYSSSPGPQHSSWCLSSSASALPFWLSSCGPTRSGATI